MILTYDLIGNTVGDLARRAARHRDRRSLHQVDGCRLIDHDQGRISRHRDRRDDGVSRATRRGRTLSHRAVGVQRHRSVDGVRAIHVGRYNLVDLEDSARRSRIGQKDDRRSSAGRVVRRRSKDGCDVDDIWVCHSSSLETKDHG